MDNVYVCGVISGNVAVDSYLDKFMFLVTNVFWQWPFFYIFWTNKHPKE